MQGVKPGNDPRLGVEKRAGLVGPQTIDQWTNYSSFLYREGLLSDANGKPLTAPPDYSKLFTNDFLPGGP